MNQPALELQFLLSEDGLTAPRVMSLAIPEQAIDHGDVFTRRVIVDLILDLGGYIRERDLATVRAVEPSAEAAAGGSIIRWAGGGRGGCQGMWW